MIRFTRHASFTQYVLPFQEEDFIGSLQQHAIRTPEPDGYYHCAFCDTPMSEEDAEDATWVDSDEQGRKFKMPEILSQPPAVFNDVIQSIGQNQSAAVNFLVNNVETEAKKSNVDPNTLYNQPLEYWQKQNAAQYLTEVFFGDIPWVLLKPELYSTYHELINLIQTPDFATAIAQDLINKYRSKVYSFKERPLCESCALENLLSCKRCGKEMNKAFGEYVLAQDGNAYCEDHAGQCDACNEYIPNDDLSFFDPTQQSLCEVCYEQAESEHASRNDYSRLWEDFYIAHPELRDDDVLSLAASQHPQSPDVYITIFEDLNWSSQYGGSAWAEIARTWKAMKELRERSGELVADINAAEQIIDHCFDLAHNTGSLFTKAPESVKSWLMKALNDKRDNPPEGYLDKLSPDVKKLLKLHHDKYVMPGQSSASTWARDVNKTRNSIYKKKMQELIKAIFIGRSDYVSSELKELKPTDKDFMEATQGTKYFNSVYLLYPLLSNQMYHGMRFIERFHYLINNEPTYKPLSTLLDLFSYLHPNYVKDALKEKYPQFLEEIKKIVSNIAPGFQAINELATTYIGSGNTELLDSLNAWKREIINEQQELQSPALQTIANKFSGRLLLKLAELNQQIFYDFYALTTVLCDTFQGEEKQYCRFIKSWTATKVLDELLPIISRAVVREARHVDNNDALEFK